MSHPSLAVIRDAARTLLAMERLSAQQRLFVQHIDNAAAQLQAMLDEMPPTPALQHQILPVIYDDVFAPQQTLLGYAKLLLEQPQQFGVERLPEQQAALLQPMQEEALKLVQWTQDVRRRHFAERQQRRREPPQPFDLAALVREHLPLYRYWLRGSAVDVQAFLPPALPPIVANPYHVQAIVQHLVLTLGREFIQHGTITLGARLSPADDVALTIFAPGLRLSQDDLQALFENDGRSVYRQQIERQGATAEFTRSASGATIALWWSR